MFDIDEYNEYLEILRKEIVDCNDKDFKECKKRYFEGILNLNKDSNILFKHSLADAWARPIEDFFVIDSDKNNIVIHNEETGKSCKYTIPYDDISNIKQLASEINEEHGVLMAPVLDGTLHEMYFFNDENGFEIGSGNIWYWMNEKNFDSEYVYGKKEQIENTKKIIHYIKELQKILLKNHIKYKILRVAHKEVIIM